MRQAEMADLSPKALDAMQHLVGSLDDRGFLTVSAPDAALQTGLPLRVRAGGGGRPEVLRSRRDRLAEPGGVPARPARSPRAGAIPWPRGSSGTISSS